MLISRYTTLPLIPIAILLSYMGFLFIQPIESILGALFGYFILWLTAKIFLKIRKVEGMGQGDLELLAMIGSFIGVIGVWFTLLFSSLIGSVIGLILIITRRADKNTALAYGPFLALGAIIYVFFQPLLYNILFA